MNVPGSTESSTIAPEKVTGNGVGVGTMGEPAVGVGVGVGSMPEPAVGVGVGVGREGLVLLFLAEEGWKTHGIEKLSWRV